MQEYKEFIKEVSTLEIKTRLHPLPNGAKIPFWDLSHYQEEKYERKVKWLFDAMLDCIELKQLLPYLQRVTIRVNNLNFFYDTFKFYRDSFGSQQFDRAEFEIWLQEVFTVPEIPSGNLYESLFYDLYDAFQIKKYYLQAFQHAMQAPLQAAKMHREMTAEPDKESPSQQQFEDYLTPDGKKLLPKIMDAYRYAKPERIILAVIAMNDCSLLNEDVFKANQTHLHQALKATFPNVGERQNLHKWITNLERPNQNHSKKLEKAKKDLLKIRDL